MSAPSRRPEIRRRRARQHKITTLRKRLASAQTDADRNRVTAKTAQALHRFAGSASDEVGLRSRSGLLRRVGGTAREKPRRIKLLQSLPCCRPLSTEREVAPLPAECRTSW